MRFTRADFVFAITVAALLAIAYALRHALLIIYVAVILAIVLAPAVDRLRRWRLGSWQPGRGTGVLLLLLLLAGVVAAFSSWLIPQLTAQARTLAADWPSRLAAVAATLHRFPGGAGIHAADLQESSAAIAGSLNGLLSDFTASLRTIMVLALLTAYFIVDGERAFRWLTGRLRPSVGHRLVATLGRAEVRISRWIFGQMLLMLFIAMADLIVYGLAGIHYFVFLALLAGLLNIIPIVGPLLGLLPAAIVAGTQSPGKLIAVLLFYGIYQQIDNSYITPRVMRATVDVSPIAVIVALIVGAELAGIMGALVAVPTAALVEILLEEYVVQKPHPQPVSVEA
jgi:predicted PurR-regulated permease PerM